MTKKSVSKERNLQLFRNVAGMLILCLFISMTPITAFAKSSSKETYDLTIRTEKDFIQFIKNIEKGKIIRERKLSLRKTSKSMQKM